MAAGYTSNNVAPDPQYVAYPSTSVDKPDYENSTVLLPGLAASGSANGGERYVLGPSEMTGHSIASATATQDQTGQWVVDYTLTGPGSALWDKVAQENFHQLLGIELDGIVYSAPIIQPTQSAFTSFDGKGEISGSLTQGGRPEPGPGDELRRPAGDASRPPPPRRCRPRSATRRWWPDSAPASAG